MNNDSSFEFVVEDHAKEWHRLQFRAYDDAAKPWFSGVWQRMTMALATAHQQANSNSPDWVQWKPWDWCEKKRQGYDPRETIVAWCGP